MLYSEQAVGEVFEPICSAAKAVTLALSGEINDPGFESIFDECIFKSGFNEGSLSMKNVTNVVFNKCRFESGSKFCIDMSRCQGLLFKGCSFDLSGDKQILIRCSSNLIRFVDCEFTEPSGEERYAFSLGPWSEEEKSWRPPVSNVRFEDCKFSDNLKAYIAFRSLPANIDGKIVAPWFVDLIWYIARKILPKKKGVDYSVYSHEQI